MDEFGFEQVDRNAIINMKRAAAFDPELRVVRFDSSETPGKTAGIYATVSEANIRKVSHLIRESVGKNEYECGRSFRGKLWNAGWCPWSRAGMTGEAKAAYA